MTDTITAIVQEKRGSLITFEGGDELWLTNAQLREHSTLREGMQEDVDALRQWLLPRQYQEALNYAVSLLAMRDRAAGEIRQKLSARRYMEETVDMVLYKLRKENLLDDEKFACAWAASRTRQQMGKSRILLELRRKGISEQTAKVALEELDEEERDDAAATLALKLLKRYASEPDRRRAMNKLLAAMARRGYGYEESRAAAQQAINRLREEEE